MSGHTGEPLTAGDIHVPGVHCDDALHQPQSSESRQFKQVEDAEQFDEGIITLEPEYVILTMPSAAIARVVDPSCIQAAITSAAEVDQTTVCDVNRTSTVH